MAAKVYTAENYVEDSLDICNHELSSYTGNHNIMRKEL